MRQDLVYAPEVAILGRPTKRVNHMGAWHSGIEYRGTCFAEGQLIGIHDAKMEEAKVAHGAGGGANVEWIARLDKDDAQVVELGEGRQGSEFTAGEKR